VRAALGEVPSVSRVSRNMRELRTPLRLWHHALRTAHGLFPMAQLLEYVGNIHIFLGPYRGNPIALYLHRDSDSVQIAPKVYPWSEVIGKGATPNRAAADFEEKWKHRGLAPEMYTGPHWEGGIKPEKPTPPKPTPPKPAAEPKPASAPTTATTGSDTGSGESSSPN
jgi:hypothetical protein